MRLLPFLLPNTITFMEYHFQQLTVAESALPLKVCTIAELTPNTEPDRSTKGPVWQQIRSSGQEALQEILRMWIQREIYTCLRNMNDWKRKKPKKPIQLSSKAKDLVCVGHQS